MPTLEGRRAADYRVAKCRTGQNLGACESISFFPHTKSFFREKIRAPEPSEPGPAPKRGR